MKSFLSPPCNNAQEFAHECGLHCCIEVPGKLDQSFPDGHGRKQPRTVAMQVELAVKNNDLDEAMADSGREAEETRSRSGRHGGKVNRCVKHNLTRTCRGIVETDE